MASMLEYKCPCCGGAITFNSDLQKMKCPYCDTEFETETLKALDEALKNTPSDDMAWETSAGQSWKEGEGDGIAVFICNSCGGEIVGDENTAATSCPYCGNPVVMAGRLSGELRPDYVIPFKLDKKAARQQLSKHLTGKRLLPKVFKDENHIDEVKGIYVPFWLFDANAQASVQYKATQIRTWSDSRYMYTKTSFFSVFRAGEIGFERVPADGSSKIADCLMESIEPYDFSDAVDFQTAYLAGYFADKYDVTAEESIGRVNERIRQTTEQLLAGTVKGYASVTPESSHIRLSDSKTKYALYPVWLLNTTWKGEKYTFAMNGQTGKFVGDLPLDRGAYCRWLLALTAGIGAVVYGLAWLIHLFL